MMMMMMMMILVMMVGDAELHPLVQRTLPPWLQLARFLSTQLCYRVIT